MVDPQTVAQTCHYVGFCALKTADQAAWAGAIGSLLAAAAAAWAAWTALKVAGKEQRYRDQLRRDDGVVAASFIYSDISKLAIYGCALHKAAIALSKAKPGDDMASSTITIRQTTGPMKHMAERMSLDWIKVLPVDTARNVARSVGALSLPVDLIEQVTHAWGNMAINAETAQKQLYDHAVGLHVPLRNLVPFFRWYGKELKEYKIACNQTVNSIYAEVGPPMGEADLDMPGTS